MRSVVAIVLALIVAGVASTSAEVEVYRLVQYDMVGLPFGSRVASMDHFAGSSMSPSGSHLQRIVITVYARELFEENQNFIREYIAQGKPLAGLLVLLPHFCHIHSCDCLYTHAKKQLANLEQKLIHSTFKYPVYFAFENQELAKVLADIRRNDEAGQPAKVATGGYKFIVKSPAPKKIAFSSLMNFQGWLPGLQADGDSNQLPTIAIVASKDTFGAAPALSVGSDSNGSGVVALLAIARLFSTLYSNPSTRGRYNILFGLTSGGPYNYNGTQQWLRGLDPRLLESIDYAICLNSLGSITSNLWLHVSEPPENAFVKQILEGFSNVAEELGLKVGLKHSTLNVSSSRVVWEHEQFSRLRVSAATLSKLFVAPNFLENTGGIFDRIEFINEEAVVQSVKLVAGSLFRHIYGLEGKNISILADEGSLAVNRSYIKTWLHFISSTPRVAPFTFEDKAYLLASRKIFLELASYVAEAYPLPSKIDEKVFTFYDSIVNTLQIDQVEGVFVTYELFSQLVIGGYLIALFTIILLAGVRVIILVLSLLHKASNVMMKQDLMLYKTMEFVLS